MHLSTREFRERLLRRARKARLRVTPEVASGLEAYFRLLSLWNRKINLSAFPLEEASEEAVDRLLIEPLAAARYVPPDAALIDLGSGGGSPAIPMKLALPELRLRMVESKTRKAAFLREAVRELHLARVEVETARFEELLSRPELHESHDVATLRAVRIESRILMGVQAFLRSGGQIMLFRGARAPEVLGMLMPPLVWEGTHSLIDTLASRLVVVRKTGLPGGPRPAS